MSKMTRRIVVDASIAMSAGTRSHPSSQRSREFLLDMLDICHRLVTSKDISVEWKRHASKFSIGWLAAMRSKGKIITVTPTPKNIMERIMEASDWSGIQIAAMEKDLLLILAAMETDELIASADSTVRDLFAKAASTVDSIARIVWVNPITESDHCGEWLKAGARYHGDLALGSLPDPMPVEPQQRGRQRRKSTSE